MATYQINANQGTVSTTSKGTMLLWTVTTLRRLKIYEFDVGATGVPNATDCDISIDLARSVATSLVAGTAYAPNPTDPADGDGAATSVINITTELTGANFSSAAPEYSNGMNQRNTIRWVAAQESQFLISAATSLFGHYMRISSPNYAGSIQTNVYYLE